MLISFKKESVKMEIKDSRTVVIKVGTSTLTYENGKVNFRRIDKMCRVISDLQNSGKKIILVSSGAIGIGVGKMGLKEKPTETSKKQALAAIGQCELMFIYDKFFSEYNQNTAQILLTKDDIMGEHSRQNIVNTLSELIMMDIVPVINENDTVAIYELAGANIGDNDTLSAVVAQMANADSLVILTDIDGLYDKDPRTNPDAELIRTVTQIDDSVKALAGGSGSNRGTGGMITKITAAQIANDAGIDCIICNGQDPEILYDLFSGEDIGTTFKAE